MAEQADTRAVIQNECSLYSSSSEKVAVRKYNDYLKSLDGKTINEYFNIPFPKFELKRVSNKEYIFKILHVNVYKDLIKLHLPDDVIKRIKEYVEIGFVCKYNICFTKDTPFRAPKWTTIEYHHLNLKDDKIWITLENKHNYEYKHDWSPSITMEKDILYFIERLLLTLHKINIA